MGTFPLIILLDQGTEWKRQARCKFDCVRLRRGCLKGGFLCCRTLVYMQEKTENIFSTSAFTLFWFFFSQLPFYCVSFSNSLLWYNFLKYSTKHFSFTGLIQESVLKRNPRVDVRGQSGGWWEFYKIGKQYEKGGWHRKRKEKQDWNHELALTTKINCNIKCLDYLVHF